jgi:UDP-N-acetylmuramoylalanine--D-glutamate ligase
MMQQAGEHPPDVTSRRITVVGAARSGRAVALLLHRRCARVFVTDASPRERNAGAVRELEEAGIPAEFGGHSAAALDADIIVTSPGVPSSAPPVKAALEHGIPVYSELEVASWFCNGPILAVTGTNGKTTTTTLAARMMEDARMRIVLGGNIGTAFSGLVEAMDEGTTAVLEVSSFQLDHIRWFRPRTGVLLNITPDHLDRYGGEYGRYIAAKGRLMENQRTGDTVIYNADDPVTVACIRDHTPPGVRRLAFSTGHHVENGAWAEDGEVILRVEGSATPLIRSADISIPGRHNLANAMAAALAARIAGVPAASIRSTLRNFKGVEHRLEFVREIGGVQFVNDSKATNVDAVWYALQSFDRPLVLLLGGRDKGNDYTRLLELVRDHVKAIVAIGESAEKVVRAFTGVVPVTTADSMDAAVRTAAATARPGDTVLLSPACASFDWFENYEHRGSSFRELVAALGERR